MKKMFKCLALIALLFAQTGQAENIKNPQKLLKKPAEGCVGGGFLFWDSKTCLFVDDSIYLNKKWQPLKLVSTKTKLKTQDKESIGDRIFKVYAGRNITVNLELTLLKGCDFDADNCEIRNYFAKIFVTSRNAPALKFEAVGYSGS